MCQLFSLNSFAFLWLLAFYYDLSVGKYHGFNMIFVW